MSAELPSFILYFYPWYRLKWEYHILVLVVLSFQHTSLSSNHQRSIKLRPDSLLWDVKMQPRNVMFSFVCCKYQITCPQWKILFRAERFIIQLRLVRICSQPSRQKKWNFALFHTLKYSKMRIVQRLKRWITNRGSFFVDSIHIFQKMSFNLLVTGFLTSASSALTDFNTCSSFSVQSVAQYPNPSSSHMLVCITFVLPLEPYNTEDVEYNQTKTDTAWLRDSNSVQIRWHLLRFRNIKAKRHQSRKNLHILGKNPFTLNLCFSHSKWECSNQCSLVQHDQVFSRAVYVEIRQSNFKRGIKGEVKIFSTNSWSLSSFAHSFTSPLPLQLTCMKPISINHLYRSHGLNQTEHFNST